MDQQQPEKKKPTREERIQKTMDLIEKQAQRAEALRKRKQQLEKRLSRLKAPDSKARKKRNDHRKFLLGALLLEKVRRGELSEQQVGGWLNAFLTNPKDREVFGLDTGLLVLAEAEPEEKTTLSNIEDIENLEAQAK